VTLTFVLYRDSVKMNQRVKYIGHRSFCSKDCLNVGQTDRHTRQTSDGVL